MMSHDKSVTGWIDQLKKGDERAAQEVWDRYFEKLVRLARKKLSAVPKRVADEEDVALSAFNSFCAGVADGRFPQLNDRHDLWKVLVTITARKATAQLRREHRQKRGGGLVRGESAFGKPGVSDQDAGIEMVLADEPTPAFAAQVADECRHLLDGLDDETLRTIAVWKMEGYTNIELADRLGCAVRTVERKLERIREKWENAN